MPQELLKRLRVCRFGFCTKPLEKQSDLDARGRKILVVAENNDLF
jgi:hypothetical protein